MARKISNKPREIEKDIITLDMAKRLKVGQHIYMKNHYDSRGCRRRWKVNGVPKTWKTHPDWVKVPLKYGLYDYGYLDNDNLEHFSMEDDCRPIKKRR